MASETPTPTDGSTQKPDPGLRRSTPLPFPGAGDSSFRFYDEMRCLQQRRLWLVTWIMLAAFAAFLGRNFAIGLYSDDPTTGWVHLAVCLLIAVPLLLLAKKCEFSLVKLRLMEGLVFGVPAAFFAWMQFRQICECDPLAATKEAAAYPGEVSLMWMILVQLYALYVPMATRCSTAIIVTLSAIPLVVAVPAGLNNTELRAVLFEDRMFSAMLLWSGISATIAIYRTHHFGKLRREAFNAERLGSYTLREKIGTGGMGAVYRAEHALLKRPAAIKLIREDKAGDRDALARFEEEVQAAACLTHPNTIEIYDYGHAEDGTFYYVMEYLPGLSLQELVDQHGPLSPERSVHVLRQVASALREAHLRGMVHRDVKPSNIFVTERGGVHDVAKLLDFGLVKTGLKTDSDMKLTMDGALVGSPLYAAPETTTSQNYDARSDVYSLGATLFYTLVGRPVFEGDNALKVLFAHANETPPSILALDPTLPDEMAAIVDRCLKKDPAERFQSIDELVDAFDALPLTGHWDEREAEAWWATHGDHATNACKKVFDSGYESFEETLVVAGI